MITKLIIFTMIEVMILIVIHQVDRRTTAPTKLLKTIAGLSVVLFITLTSYAVYTLYKSEQSIPRGTVQSNEKSQYSDLWLQYQSYYDMKIGSVGGISRFKDFLKSKNLTDKEFALQTIEEMLKETKAVENPHEVALQCVEENYKEEK